MKGHVVEEIEDGFLAGSAPEDVLMAFVNGAKVAGDRFVAINKREFGFEIRFVEIIGVRHVDASDAGVEGEGCIWADKHGDAACASGGTGGGLVVEGDVRGHNDGVSAVPGT